MADDYVPYVPIPYTPLPYVSSREYSNRPYTQSLMELVGRAGQREAEATRRRSELLASRTGALGQIASSTLGSLFAGRDEAAKLAAAREQQRLENDYRERVMQAAADERAAAANERKAATEERGLARRYDYAKEARNYTPVGQAVPRREWDAIYSGTPSESSFTPEDQSFEMNGSPYADSPTMTRMADSGEQLAINNAIAQERARRKAEEDRLADNLRAETAARELAKYRGARLQQGQEGQIFQGPNGPVLVNRSKGTSTSVLNPDGSPMVTSSDLPPRVATRVDSKVRAFDANPLVKRIVTMAEGAQFVRSLDINTTNPADDQALIYAFAKAMDPESVVREGEYATVMKYAQSWAKSFEFDAKRMFSETPFLTPTARQNMRDTITKKFKAGQQQYQTLRKEYARQLNMVVGSDRGADYLTDYSAGFPADDGPRMVRDAQGNLRPEGE